MSKTKKEMTEDFNVSRKIAKNMINYGGAPFTKNLGILILSSSHQEANILKKSFPRLWEKYTKKPNFKKIK